VTIEAEALRVLAPAKVNLFLHVGDKRTDGYHALQSLVAFTHAGDELAMSPDRELKLVIDGPFAKVLKADADNLVLKAARALAAHAGVKRGATISLTKNLPIASGIGGGSADAAATLRGLAQLWGLKLDGDDLLAIAETLGSDVPVCVSSRAQWMEGRGEILTALEPLPVMAMVLVNPGVAVPTSKVFAALKDRRGTTLSPPPKSANVSVLITYLKDTSNDLEAPARSIAPVIDEVLSVLADQPGALLARMSGSGATCFALFDTDEAATKAAVMIGVRHPKWWTVSTKIAPLSAAVLQA
jgi:4-diphosphocytidyl-2-C-methyl-D-erythritol kinase